MQTRALTTRVMKVNAKTAVTALTQMVQREKRVEISAPTMTLARTLILYLFMYSQPWAQYSQKMCKKKEINKTPYQSA